MRKTKIVATVGPACSPTKILDKMFKEGVDVFRINASHSTPAGIQKWVKKIRKAERSAGKTVAIMVDLQGPRLRTGSLFEKKPLIFKRGQSVTISTVLSEGRGDQIACACREFPQMVKKKDPILLDNGAIELETVSKTKTRILCRVIYGGALGENKGINLPNAPVTLPALSEKDQKDLKMAAKLKVDYVALSFVRSDKDIYTIKRWLKKRHYEIPIIAKIEKPRAVNNLASILTASDGVMVARGDLGIEMGVEKVPMVQKRIIEEANSLRIPVITATQMLESMIHQSRPTRAEASDIANAVIDGTDAVMLSGETSIGEYPLEAVKVMAKIIHEAEKHMGETDAPLLKDVAHDHNDLPIHAITHAARHAAKDLHAKAIVVFTLSGKTAAYISKFHPVSPIIVFTQNIEVSRQLALFRGVLSQTIAYGRNTDVMIQKADKALLKMGIVRRGDPVVIISGKLALPAARFMTKINLVGIN